MAIRFRKSIKLAPGIKWNLSGGGSSFTFGPRGASINVGKRGSYLNTGIPGTGFASRAKLSSAPPPPSPMHRSVSMTCGVAEDGVLYFKDADGRSMPEHIVEVAKKQNRQVILGLIEQQCQNINEQVEALGALHHETPDARVKPRFATIPFDRNRPSPPILRRPHFLHRILGMAAKIEAKSAEARERFVAAEADYATGLAAHQRVMADIRDLIENKIYNDVAAMEQHLENSLGDVQWPRETNVSFEIGDGGATGVLDVDLPEIEDMPTKTALVPQRGLKLSVKEMSSAKVQKLYAAHVHGIVFRLLGEVFAALPNMQQVIVSGYSQRRGAADGQLHDEYLLSVRASRDTWLRIDFAHLEAVDPVQALSTFELRRDMLKNGAFRGIQPLVSDAPNAVGHLT
jgi:hypothetical protein